MKEDGTPNARRDQRRRRKRQVPLPQPLILQPDELRRVVRALAEEPQRIQAFLLTVLLTGYRPSEVQQMRWDELDLLDALWNRPANVSKIGRPQTLPLPRALVPSLTGLPRVSPQVFTPSERPKWMTSRADMASWTRIRTRAHLRPCSAHILRHSFRQYLAQQGSSLAQLDVHRLRAAQDEYAQAMLTGPQTGGHDAV